MNSFPVFLSVIYVVRNQVDLIESIVQRASEKLRLLVTDYELIIVDNASNDETVNELKTLTGKVGYPNLQVYVLTKEVNEDIASWVGLENALGDFVAVLDPMLDDIGALPEILDKAVNGADVVFANNLQKPHQTFTYRMALAAFNFLYKSFNGIHLTKEAPPCRLLSRSIVNFILQHPQPALTYRHLPVTGGFARINIDYSANPLTLKQKKLGESIDRGMRLLVSTTQAPMRLVTSLSLFGAAANLIYSVYVLSVGIFKADVAPGWVSMSLQQSGMFFLISLVLLVLGEYILHMASLSNEGPLYHVGQEFTSARMMRRERLNIEVVSSSVKSDSLSNSHRAIG
ncbi:glycosyltransferase [Polynucleobacter sphagniphilus]|uniref:glycosyltransferase n=1 Tax=Polynucleobacter sphagniphilus TaxID=1743169 RepID=UPI00096B85A4|nr:glycosyltransferase [Polynucleobacter sphagniphilus]OLY97126.1 glycosyl transferase [Polynucleobacter sphagniphilus]